MNYNSLKSDIAAVVRENGNQEITGKNLQGVLSEMIDNSVGTGYLYKGIATPETQGGTPDQNVFYFAGAGTYTNFGSTKEIPEGSVGIIKYDGEWKLDLVEILNTGEVFDISAYHATGGELAKYANLAAALGINGANIPQSLHKGGMSVKFVQSSDNKYVQYRLTSPTWSIEIHDWTSEDPYFIDKIMQEVNEAIDEHTPIEITGDVTNAPDEEDLTSDSNDLLKFKDKLHSPIIYSGLGRKYLRKNIVNGVNTLTQDMFKTTDNVDDLTDTIFIIQYDYVIPQGTTITIPERCVLKFEGGSISGEGTLVGNNTIIDAGQHSKIFGEDLITSGTFQSDCYVDWFGANSNASHAESDSASIQAALDSAFEIIKFNAGFYNIGSTIVLRYLKKIESVPNNGGENWNNNIKGTVFRVNSNIDCFKIQLETMAHSYNKRLNLRFGTFLISAQTNYNSNVLTIFMPNRELWNSNIEISAIHPLKSSSNASLNDIDNRGTVVRFVDSSPVGGGMYIVSLTVNAFGFKEVLSESVSKGLISNVNLTGFAHSCGRIVDSDNASLFSHGYIKMLCQTGCLFNDETHSAQYPWISGVLANCHIDCAFWDTATSFNKGRHMINVDLTKAFYGVTLSQQSYKGPVTAYKNLANTEQKRTQPRSTYILESNIQNLPNDFTNSFVKKIDNALLDWHNKGFIQNVTVSKTNLVYSDDTISDDIFKNAFTENGCKVPIEIEDANDINSTSLEITYQINWSNDSTSRIRELIIHRNGYGYVFNKCELTLLATDGTTVLEKETYIYHAEPNALDSDILASIKLNKSNKTRPGFINLKFSDFVIVTSSQSYKNFHLFIEGSIGSNNTPNIQMNRVCSANRPTFTKLFVGVCVFDTKKNKPIWWNGTNWVDATGTVV